MRKKICFVGLDSYPVLNPSVGEIYTGGESVQQSLLAKAFRDQGYQVSVVVKDFGQCDGEIIDGIQIWKSFKDGAGLPVIRFIYPKMTSIIAALKNADAEVYYQSCAGMLTGLVAWFCQRNRRCFIFRSASDTDCIRGRQLIKYWRDRKLYEYGLRRADIIAVQGVKQQRLLKENYHLHSEPVNMAVEPPGEGFCQVKDIDVLWVNNIRPLKRPEIFLDLAVILSDFRFVMIGGPCPGHESYYNQILDKAKLVSNLQFLGPIPYSRVWRYFARAKVFVNTSNIEGFPNSFLQAWVRGVPVVSFFDPDGLITNKCLGYVPFNTEEMAKYICNFLEKRVDRLSVGDRAAIFVKNHFSAMNAAEHYIKLLETARQ